MALRDLLYPGNPERREMVIRKNQELIELMKRNFEATNNLTKIVNEHLHSSFSPITLNEKATVKENCEVMIERVKQIQAKVQEVDKKLKEMLEPTLYEELQKMSLKSFKEIPAALKVAISAVFQISGALLVGYLMKKGLILANISCTCVRIAGGIFASLAIGLAVDLIVSAIWGGIERGQLETALAEHDKALKTFRPASEEYQKAIYRVMFRLEDME